MTFLAEETTRDLIEAVGGLWRLALMLVLLAGVILFRRPIAGIFNRFDTFRYKRGDVEVCVDSERKPTEPKLGEGTAMGAPEQVDAVQQALAPKPDEPADASDRMLEAFHQERFEDAASAHAEIQRSEKSEEEKARNDVLYLIFKFTCQHDGSALADLEALAQQGKAQGLAYYGIGLCRRTARDYSQAIMSLRKSLSGPLDDDEIAHRTACLAECLSENGQAADAVDELKAGLSKVHKDSAKAKLYAGLAAVYRAQGNAFLRSIAVQKALQYSPEDSGLLFRAAYAEAEAKMSMLAALNYDTLLRLSPRNGSALNNLGVECGRLGLPMKSVSYYRQAGAAKNTLALANYAFKCLDAGLEDEARTALQEAMQDKMPDPHVGQAMVRLEERVEKEREEWSAFTRRGIAQREFVWTYAEAYFAMAKDAHLGLAGQWVSLDGNVFEVACDGGTVTGKWELGHKGEEFTGTVRGKILEVQYRKKCIVEIFQSSTWGDKQPGFGYVDKEGRSIFIQIGEGKDVFFLNLTRKD
ncbi:MAG: hypothetical protein IMZ65_02300 [Planctomycetes bacterium]|nr:hypothetical protein [Planctomycetota bacterium]